MTASSSTPASLADASRDLAVELHGILLDLDPARWRADVAAASRARLAGLQTRIGELVEAAGSDSRVTAVRNQLGELGALLKRRLPSVGSEAEWMALREKLQPAYEGLAKALRAHAIHVPSLRPTNYLRNVLHVATALTSITVALLLPSIGWGMVVTALLAGTCWSLETTRRIWPEWNEKLMKALGMFAHPHEAHRVNSSTWYMTGLFVLTFFGSLPLVAVAMAVLGFGDPAAAVVGRRFGRIELIHGRSLEGSLTFAVVGTIAAFGVLALATPLSAGIALAVAAGASVFGAAVELVSHRIDDNLSIPLAAAGGAALMAGLLGVVI